MQEKFDQWCQQRRKQLGWALEYDTKYDAAYDAFLAGYELGKKEGNDAQTKTNPSV